MYTQGLDQKGGNDDQVVDLPARLIDLIAERREGGRRGNVRGIRGEIGGNWPFLFDLAQGGRHFCIGAAELGRGEEPAHLLVEGDELCEQPSFLHECLVVLVYDFGSAVQRLERLRLGQLHAGHPTQNDQFLKLAPIVALAGLLKIEGDQPDQPLIDSEGKIEGRPPAVDIILFVPGDLGKVGQVSDVLGGQRPFVFQEMANQGAAAIEDSRFGSFAPSQRADDEAAVWRLFHRCHPASPGSKALLDLLIQPFSQLFRSEVPGENRFGQAKIQRRASRLTAANNPSRTNVSRAAMITILVVCPAELAINWARA